ncbi:MULTISPECIES: S49 family peptidase [Legionella]|uniref:S49 family peptidase n=1 Tax=Legionella TaxID=445 RepID=UPI000F8F1F7A|nr:MULTISPECIES: S49 family peptidase [Legionella]MCP0914301.1 S49 family peptidase [Legionella sp. 27cVA30]RUR11799.1 S49 family peptidase [Legionella septentrionalis]RUR17487.1 S49 family peptidase [Legionella septentrionalis]
MNNNPLDSNDSQLLLNKIVLEYMREQKRKRFWRWVMRAVVLVLVLWLAYQFLFSRSEEAGSRAKEHVGLIDVNGTIFASQAANGDNFVKGLDKAYENKSMKALIIRIDSPGGSPVQADYMYNALQHYRKKYPKIKTYAVCVDACASAAYYVAAAADEIYANPASLVGSIGVLYNGFGFVDAMQKLGVSRRLVTAGRNKGFLDQFSPMDSSQEKMLQTMLDLIHQEFINKVKQGRGTRLKIDEDTFSGLYWTGMQAKERGLIDGFASSGQLAREIIKIDNIVDYTYKESVLERVAKNIGTAMAEQLPSALGIRPGLQ